MKPLARRTALVFAAAGLLAGTAVGQTRLADLAGNWQSEPTAGDASTPTRVTRVSARWVLDDSWLRLELEEQGDSGRHHRAELMLHQAEDGSVSGFLFTAAAAEALRLTGRWSGDELALAGPREGDEWVWRRESTCYAHLSRPPTGREAGPGAVKSRLRSAACEPTRIARQPPAAGPVSGAERADGRPTGSEPAAVAAAVEEEPAAGERREEARAADTDTDATRRDPAAAQAQQPPAPPVATDVGEVGMDEDESASGAEGAEIEVGDLPAARPAAAPAADAARSVLLAGRGKPFDEVKKAIALLREFLLENDVQVEVPSDEIVVLQAADASLAYLVREVRDRGAASLLYVTASFGGRERIVVECYDGNGLLLWKEKTVGGTGLRQFKWMNPKLVERIEERLKPRIGGVGLPAGNAKSPSP